MNTILYLLREYNTPLASPNSHVSGNVGERKLAVKPYYFNPGPDAEVIPAGNIEVEFGGRIVSYAMSEMLLSPGENRLWPGFALDLPLDLPGDPFPLTGEFELRVTRSELFTAIVVRLDQTDLYLVSPWPEPLNTNEAAEIELAEARAELNDLAVSIAQATDRQFVLNKRIPILEALLESITNPN